MQLSSTECCTPLHQDALAVAPLEAVQDDAGASRLCSRCTAKPDSTRVLRDAAACALALLCMLPWPANPRGGAMQVSGHCAPPEGHGLCAAAPAQATQWRPRHAGVRRLFSNAGGACARTGGVATSRCVSWALWHCVCPVATKCEQGPCAFCHACAPQQTVEGMIGCLTEVGAVPAVTHQLEYRQRCAAAGVREDWQVSWPAGHLL